MNTCDRIDEMSIGETDEKELQEIVALVALSQYLLSIIDAASVNAVTNH